MTPADRPAVVHFVRVTLGCKCPDEVFSSVVLDRPAAPNGAIQRTRLVVGNRLLIYVVEPMDGRDTSGVVARLAREGVADRDSRGLNRFRLVVAVAQPAQLAEELQAGFAGAAGQDDRAHLHVIGIDALPKAVRTCAASQSSAFQSGRT